MSVFGITVLSFDFLLEYSAVPVMQALNNKIRNRPNIAVYNLSHTVNRLSHRLIAMIACV